MQNGRGAAWPSATPSWLVARDPRDRLPSICRTSGSVRSVGRCCDGARTPPENFEAFVISGPILKLFCGSVSQSVPFFRIYRTERHGKSRPCGQFVTCGEWPEAINR
jgi:hypothetical protein